MRKKFNTTGLCLPQKHYMADISGQICQIAAYVKEGSYFSINCARQYGKTTMLYALARYLHEDYLVISLDFQALGHASFQNENIFSLTFAQYFLRELQLSACEQLLRFKEQTQRLQETLQAKESGFVLFHLFEYIAAICQAAPKPIVLMIDEADSASDNQVFLDFLAQLRYYYLEREKGRMAAFHSVILTGVYDIRSLKMKIRSESEHRLNSPWTIAADFKVDLSLSVQGIVKMLEDYEKDCHTGMDILEIAEMIYDYTCGYPFLVSRICKLIDENMQESSTGCGNHQVWTKSQAWTKEGILSAIRKLFLLYLRPIINGSGNYYIEARTRSMGRTDVVVDYRGVQYVIEMKIWRGQEYHRRGEQQIVGYLDDYHIKKGYMLSFCFNRKKQIGVKDIVVGDKIVTEAIV